MFFRTRSSNGAIETLIAVACGKARGQSEHTCAPHQRTTPGWRAVLLAIGALGLTHSGCRAESLTYSIERRVPISEPYSFIYSAGISDGGNVAFLAQLSAGGQAIYSAAPGGAPVQLANTAGPYANFSYFGEVNTSGTVAFAANMDDGTQGIYTASAGVAPVEIARTTANGFTFLARPSLNDSGTVAFPGESGGKRGIYTAAAGAAPARKADDSGPVSLFGSDSPITAAGKTVFLAVRDVGGEAIYTLAQGGAPVEITSTSGPTSSLYNHGVPSLSDAGYVSFAAGRDLGGDGIYLSISGGAPVEVANTSGIFSEFLGTDVNASGLMAFLATLDGNAGLAVYYRPLGQSSVRLIGPGDNLDGSTVTGISYGASLLNDAGQIAFVANLADGRSGVYVASTVPEPSCLLALGTIPLLALRRRHSGARVF